MDQTLSFFFCLILFSLYAILAYPHNHADTLVEPTSPELTPEQLYREMRGYDEAVPLPNQNFQINEDSGHAASDDGDAALSDLSEDSEQIKERYKRDNRSRKRLVYNKHTFMKQHYRHRNNVRTHEREDNRIRWRPSRMSDKLHGRKQVGDFGRYIFKKPLKLVGDTWDYTHQDYSEQHNFNFFRTPQDFTRDSRTYIYGVNLDYLAEHHPAKRLREGEANLWNNCDRIQSVPDHLRDPRQMWPEGIQYFYTKYTHAYGIPIIGSSNVTDEGLRRACYEVYFLLSSRYDIRNAYYKLYGRVAVIGDGEQQTSLPEYQSFESRFWDTRARGLGATIAIPTTSVGDDNMRCAAQNGGTDRYWNQDILAHEFGHSMHLMGAIYVIRGFARRIGNAYREAVDKHLWESTYAGSNRNEYFAVGNQFYFNAVTGNKITPRGSGYTVTDRDSLKAYDSTLYYRLMETFSCDPSEWVERCDYKGRPTPRVQQHCATGPNNSERCTSVPYYERIRCGPPTTNNEECSRMGCCWDGEKCHYPENDCKDVNMQCAEVAQWGWCDSNPAYMTINCPFSCDTCRDRRIALSRFSKGEIDNMCQSKKKECVHWASQGLCNDHWYKPFIASTCALHCGLCTPSPNPFGFY